MNRLTRLAVLMESAWLWKELAVSHMPQPRPGLPSSANSLHITSSYRSRSKSAFRGWRCNPVEYNRRYSSAGRHQPAMRNQWQQSAKSGLHAGLHVILKALQMGNFEKLRGWARKIKRDGVTLWFACRHPDTPMASKLLGLVVVAYALSPIDLIPDFIPVLGYLDDVILLPVMIWLAVRLIPADILAACTLQANEWMAKEGLKPSSNWGIIFVLLVWALASWSIWKYLVSPYF